MATLSSDFSNLSTIGTTDCKVSKLGFGGGTLGNLYHTISDQTALEAVQTALQNGVNYFDTAPFYGVGLSERRLGDALRSHMDSVVISTKVGRLNKPCKQAMVRNGFHSPLPFEPIYDYSYDGVMRSYEDSLQRLGVSRVDILFIHDIGRLIHGDANDALFKTAMDGGYRALAELREQGLVKAIGLGVNEFEVCEDAMRHGDFDCFLLAGRYTLLEQTALQSFLPQCEAKQISVIIGGPYNSGILAKGSQGAGITYNYAPPPADIIAKVQQIEAACEEFNVTLPAAALQFPLAHPAVASVIPGLSSAKRANTTAEQLQQHIPADFWKALKHRGLIAENAPIPTE